jgi:hypothetical protein
MESLSRYPTALDPSLVGSYPASAKAGGGYVWDAVLEYRVWCYPRAGAADEFDGADYYSAFATYEEAEEFSASTAGAQKPLALVLQEEYIAEEEPGQYVHVKERRIGSMSPLQSNHAIEVSTAMRQDLWHVVFSPLCP